MSVDTENVAGIDKGQDSFHEQAALHAFFQFFQIAAVFPAIPELPDQEFLCTFRSFHHCLVPKNDIAQKNTSADTVFVAVIPAPFAFVVKLRDLVDFKNRFMGAVLCLELRPALFCKSRRRLQFLITEGIKSFKLSTAIWQTTF